MLKFICMLSLLYLVNFANAQQTKRHKLTLEEYDAQIQASSKCLKRNTYSVDKRRLMFPFKGATKVSIISFRDTTSFMVSRIPIKDAVLDSGLVLEEKVLTQKEVDQLTDLIFNYGFKTKIKYRLITNFKCYDPHNGILFYDENKHVNNFIEICFDCQKFRSNVEKLNLGENCTEKFTLLKSFFLKNGVTKLSSEDIYTK